MIRVIRPELRILDSQHGSPRLNAISIGTSYKVKTWWLTLQRRFACNDVRAMGACGQQAEEPACMVFDATPG